MNTLKFFSRAFVAFLSIFLMAAVAVGQTLNLNGAANLGGTWKVKGDINNTGSSGTNSFTGIVELQGGGAQNVGGHATNAINFTTLNATTNTVKTIDVPSTISAVADVTNSATIALAATRTLTVTGDLSQTSGSYVFNNATSTVDYAGGAQNVIGATYTNLTTSAAGNKSMNNNVTVNSALTLTDGALVIGGNTLDIAGTISTTSGSLTGGGTSNLSFTGTGNASMPTVTNGLQNFTVNRTGATDVVTLGGNLTVAGSLTLTDGELSIGANTLTLNSTVTATSGTLASAAAGTVEYNQGTDGQSVLATNYGSLTFSSFNKTLPSATVGIAGTFTAGSATGHTIAGNTIDFNGAAQTIPAFNAGTGYNNLSTSGSGTKTASGAIEVAGNFDNGGAGDATVTLTMGTNALTITGTRENTSSTIQFAGGSNGRLFTTGTVEYNGSVTQTIEGHAANTYATLVFSNTGSKLITTAAGIVHTTGSLNSSADVQVGANVGDTTAELIVEGDFTIGAINVTNYGTITVGI